MNTSLAGRPGNSQTNDFIISTWYSGSMLYCGGDVELASYLPQFLLNQSYHNNRKFKGGKKRRRRHNVKLILAMYCCKFLQLQESLVIWGWSDIKSRTMFVKISFSRADIVALHIREGGIPVFPPAQDQNLNAHCEAHPVFPSQELRWNQSLCDEKGWEQFFCFSFCWLPFMLASFPHSLHVNRIHNSHCTTIILRLAHFRRRCSMTKRRWIDLIKIRMQKQLQQRQNGMFI